MLSSPGLKISDQRFISKLDSISRCARYAFGPNRLHYCGPDQSQEVLAYINEKESDKGLSRILGGFATMYPYLRNIARANKIKDPLDDRVVEAYWIGNDLLEAVTKKLFHDHLMDDLNFRLKMDLQNREYLSDKIMQGAKMHHSFHVFNVWQRTGHMNTNHDLYSMDQCRISWGEVVKVNGPKLRVKRRPIIAENNKLRLADEEEITIQRELETSSVIDDVMENDIITMHWGVPCEIINEGQLKNLKRFTQWSLILANKTI